MTTVLADKPATQNGSHQPSNFRYDIGGLRGLAILAVVVGHTFNMIGIHITGGVDMSFALSGYLITWLAIREFANHGTISLKAFYRRRIQRLLPAATLVTIATIWASWQWLPESKLYEVGTDATWSVLSAINYWYVVTDHAYVAAGVASEGGIAANSPFQHYWSLAVEEQFYLFYPVLLLAALAIGRKIGKLRAVVGVILAIIAGASFTASIILTGNKINPDGYFGAHTRVWELALGALVAVAVPLFKRLPRSLSAMLSWVGMAVILVGLATIYRYPLPGYHVAVPVIGTLLVIIGGETRPMFGAESILKMPPLQYIGKISYQWYLWHWPVLIILPYVLVGRESFAATPLDPDVSAVMPYLLGATALSFMLAVATWHLLDSPLRKQMGRSEPGHVFGMGFMMFVASFIAAVTLFVAAPQPSKEAPKAADAPVSAIQQLIEDGTTLQTLSPELKNGLTAAKEDWDLSCINTFETTTPKPCVFGAKGAKKTIVMMGDSHTTHWIPAMDAIAKKHNVKLVTYAKAVCSAEPYAILDYGTKRPYTECTKWREAVYRKVQALKPQAVIASNGLYDSTVTSTPNADVIGTATAAFIKRFTALGAKVVVFDDTPRPFIHVPDCLSQHADDAQKCTVERATAMHRPEVRAAREQAATQNGALFIKLDQWFCTASACPPVINGMVVWVDMAHISKTYALWLVPELEEVISPVLN